MNIFSKNLLYLLLVISSSCVKKVNDPTPSVNVGENEIYNGSRLESLPPAVCEAPATEDMTGASLFGNGTPGSCTQAALQTLIDNGGKIKCNCGSTPYTLTLNSSLTVPSNKEVIIDGNNLVTISGNNAVRIFDKKPSANQAGGTFFALQNITLTKGKAADGLGGAAIRGSAFGSLKVVNVIFTENIAQQLNADACGAVHTIMYKSVVFANCVFKNNKGANGAAVGTIGSASTFINCLFDFNEATGTGGTFSQGGSGGAVYVDGVDQNGINNTFSMCGSTFTNNKAGYQAGAVNVIFYGGKGSTATTDKCSFENNSCAVDKGGAYYHMNGPLVLSNSTFAGNASPVQGGGIWMTNTNLTMTNCTFQGNTAVQGTNGLGGGLCLDGSGTTKTAIITNCTFSGNRAGNFASAIFNRGIMTLTNNIFNNNLTGSPHQSNPYGGATINKNSNLTVGDGNLQFPKTYNGQWGTNNEDWITSTVITEDAKLNTLSNNGGPTKTMALSTGSPAIDKGTSLNAPTIDQRGKSRYGKTDIGAFEYYPVVNGILKSR